MTDSERKFHEALQKTYMDSFHWAEDMQTEHSSNIEAYNHFQREMEEYAYAADDERRILEGVI